ncbi:MAG: serine/threonine-protein phosphatase [Clostridiales bacterium]|nr:serine/threonine-protein phosphatase [Clostridiales bacterium]
MTLNQIVDTYITYFDKVKWILIGCLAVLLVILLVHLIVSGKKRKSEGTSAVSEKPAKSQYMDNGRFRIEIGNVQGTGEREEQQDAFAFSPSSKWKDKGFLAVLCDGMGGLDSGAAISNKLVSDIIAEFPYSFEKLKDGWILDALSNEIFQNYAGRGGTTLIITYLKDDKMWFASVGDSDLLLLRNGRIYAMNTRQEYGNTLLMRAAEGAVSVDQALLNSDAAALTEFMGAKHTNPDYSIVPWQVMDNDVYLLCSDGISDTLSFEEIREAMTHDPSECAELLEKAIIQKSRRYQDNYTAIIFAVHKIGGNS